MFDISLNFQNNKLYAINLLYGGKASFRPESCIGTKSELIWLPMGQNGYPKVNTHAVPVHPIHHIFRLAYTGNNRGLN